MSDQNNQPYWLEQDQEIDMYEIGPETDISETRKMQDGGRKTSDDVLYISQSEFAYLNKELMEDLGYNSIETDGIQACHGVALRSREGDAIALIHADKDRLKQVKQGVITANQKLRTKFDEAKLVTSTSKPEDFNEVAEYLEQEYDVDKDPRRSEGGRALGVNKEGFYEPEQKSEPRTDQGLKALEIFGREKINDVTEQLLEAKLADKWAEYDTNHLPEEISEQWAETPDGWEYHQRLHKANLELEQALYQLKFDIDELGIDQIDTDFKFEIETTTDQRRIKMWSRHPIEEDREKVEALNKQAAEIYEQTRE